MIDISIIFEYRDYLCRFSEEILSQLPRISYNRITVRDTKLDTEKSLVLLTESFVRL